MSITLQPAVDFLSDEEKTTTMASVRALIELFKETMGPQACVSLPLNPTYSMRSGIGIQFAEKYNWVGIMSVWGILHIGTVDSLDMLYPFMGELKLGEVLKPRTHPQWYGPNAGIIAISGESVPPPKYGAKPNIGQAEAIKADWRKFFNK